MTLTWLPLGELTIEDEKSFAHVALYERLKSWLAGSQVRFGVPSRGRRDHALLLNLAFWRPGDVAEVLSDDVLTADQVAHNAWHAVGAAALGEASASIEGLLLTEAIASAFDIYLVGRLMGHAPDSAFLDTQVPAMLDAALDADMDEAAFEALVQRASEQPERCFEELRQLLYDVSLALAGCDDVDAAQAVLADAEAHAWAPLLHHYELSTWVLFARCYAKGDGSGATELDRALREAPDSVAMLEERWL